MMGLGHYRSGQATASPIQGSLPAWSRRPQRSWSRSGGLTARARRRFGNKNDVLAADVAESENTGSSGEIGMATQAGIQETDHCQRSASRGRFTALKEQQLVFLLVRQLAAAQLSPSHRSSGEKLWREVADLGLDPERITRLLYGGQDVCDSIVLKELDGAWGPEKIPTGSGAPWWSWRRNRLSRPMVDAGHRSARPAGSRAHRGAR